jgi:hypothetical protein
MLPVACKCAHLGTGCQEIGMAETFDAKSTEEPLTLTRYPLGFRENSRHRHLPNLHRFEEGVLLGVDTIGWGDERKSLHSISTIILNPYDRSTDDGPKWAGCDVVFDDGTSVAITSSGRHGVISGDRDIAYTAFLRELHARLDADSCSRIAFKDGLPRKAKGMFFNFLLSAPAAAYCGYVGFTTGPIYYLAFSLFLFAVAAVFLITGIKDLRSRRYLPEKIPAHALPPPPAK